MKELSIIMPTYNRADTLRRVLQSLDNQTVPRGKFEVIIIDDGSSYDVQEYIKSFDVRYFQQENAGPSKARNLGVEKARCELVAFIGDDTMLNQDWVEQHLNPLTSLTDRGVYGIPMLLMIGWRGEPGVKDEPQHIKQGRITKKLLETLEIPYAVLSEDTESVKAVVNMAVLNAKKGNTPYAILVKKGTFERTSGFYDEDPDFSREEVIKKIVDNLDEKDIVVSTTGKASRELFEYREELGQGHEKDFLTVGSMGHASQIAYAIALAKPNRQVYCFDGDGAIIMHMGALAVNGFNGPWPNNFKHIVLNNWAHDSVGGTTNTCSRKLEHTSGC